MYKTVMTVNEFMTLLRKALHSKTIYFFGGFGQRMTKGNIDTGCKMYPYNASRRHLYDAIGNNGFGFDCVNLVKGILWGWRGDQLHPMGGAEYGSNNVPDWGADAFFQLCKQQSTRFEHIEVGDMLWVKGHFGVYAGEGLAIEVTPNWKNAVQLTAVGNIGNKAGYPTRVWTAFGKTPYLSYDQVPEVEKPEPTDPSYIPKIGDLVEFKGKMHFVSAYATHGAVCKPGLATVTHYVPGARNPYHLVAYRGGNSNVYGFVSAGDIDYHIQAPILPVPTPEIPNILIMQHGSTGDHVLVLQYILGELELDGSFGDATRARVLDFQKKHGLVQDGVVGEKTWSKLKA